jgi:hypothetical protein
MAPRVRWLIVCLVLSLVSTVAIALTVFPTWMKTYGDALAWGFVGSGLFLLATLVTGLAVVANREARLPTGIGVVVTFLLIAGVVWAFLWTVAVGL